MPAEASDPSNTNAPGQLESSGQSAAANAEGSGSAASEKNPRGSATNPAQERDAAADEYPSAGTADIERGGVQSQSQESLVQDPVGAFKERP